ncbi:peptidase S24 [Yimella sp. cx-573]|nr:peptidase S24 [Yimella sp. cx-573]
MFPTYREGDRLLVLYGARPREGRPHLVQPPPSAAGPRPLSIKRVERRTDEGWWVLSDSPDEGTDSRTFGPIPFRDMVAKILVRLPRPIERRRKRTE